jgi:1-acyl-sn-glycerol-3-phosphate acyltransferase
MYYIKKVFRAIWAVYCIIPFLLVSTFLVIGMVIFTLFIPKYGVKMSLWLCIYVGAPIMLWLFLMFPRVKNKHLLTSKSGYILVSNHSSFLDIFLNPYAFRNFPNICTYLSKVEVGNIPMFGLLARKLVVMVDRGDGASRKNSYINMKKVVNEGTSIMIYPEGTRNSTDNNIQKFFDGAFRLAIETETPLAVLTIVGIKNIADNTLIADLCPGRVDCIWDEPIDTKGMTLHDIPALKERVRLLMQGHIDAHAAIQK